MTTHLVSYASRRFLASQDALERSARLHGIDAVHSWNRARIEQSDLYRDHRAILDEPRGSGYWLWKPYIITQALAAAADGDIVVYADAGIEIVASLAPIFDLCRRDSGLALFAGHYDDTGAPGPNICGKWTKRDCFVLLDCDEPRYHEGQMLDASFLVLQKTEDVQTFVREWLRRCLDQRMITDRPNACGLPNLEGFVDHRHDQSILTLLAMRQGRAPLRHPSQYGNHLKPEAYRAPGEWTRFPYGAKGIWTNSPYPTLLDHHRGLRSYARSWLSEAQDSARRHVRPMLRPDAIAAAEGGGILFRSDQSVTFAKSERTRQLFAAIRPWLTGDHELGSIAARLPAAQREPAAALMDALLTRGVLRHNECEPTEREPTAREPTAPRLPEAVRAAFQSQVAFLRRFTDRPEAAFARYRRSRVLLAGAGPAFVRCAASLLANGLETLFMLSSDGRLQETESRDIEAVATRLRARGVTSAFVPIGDSTSGAPGALPGLSGLRHLDAIVYCSDCPNWLDILMLNRHACAADRPFLSAVVLGERSYLGPLIRPFIGGCWLCAVTRAVRDFNDPDSFVRLRAEASATDASIRNGDPAGQLARELASDTAFEIFKLRSGVMPTQSDSDIRIEQLEHGAPVVTMVTHAQTACRGWCNAIDKFRGDL